MFSHDHTLRLILYFALSVAFSLPVYDTVFHPLIKRCTHGTLKRAGVVQAWAIRASIIMFVTSLVWYTQNSPTQCVLSHMNNVSQFSVDYEWVAVPTELILYTSILSSPLVQPCWSLSVLRLRITWEGKLVEDVDSWSNEWSEHPLVRDQGTLLPLENKVVQVLVTELVSDCCLHTV